MGPIRRLHARSASARAAAALALMPLPAAAIAVPLAAPTTAIPAAPAPATGSSGSTNGSESAAGPRLYIADAGGGEVASGPIDSADGPGGADAADGPGASDATPTDARAHIDTRRDAPDPRFIAADATTVYYTAYGPGGGVYSHPRGDESDATLLEPLDHATGIALAGTTVYAVTQHGELHEYRGGEPAGVTPLRVPARANIQGMAIRDGTAYLADWADETIYAAPLDGSGQVRTVVDAAGASGLARPVGIAAYDGGLYVTELRDGASGRVSRITLDGDPQRTTVAGGLDIPTGIALAPGTRPGGVGSGAVSFGPTFIPLGPPPASQGPGTLFIAEGGAGRIVAVDVRTGGVTPAATGLDGPWGIAVAGGGAGGAGAGGDGVPGSGGSSAGPLAAWVPPALLASFGS